MPFCSNCGAKLIDNVKFCLECGEPNPFFNNNDAQRKTVFDGEVHKCPSCGEIINSLTAVCPSCGFEFSGKQISASLEKFINEVNTCEQVIFNSQKSVTGWQAWSKSKRFWWVVLNISFMCIPLVLYWVLPLIMINSTPRLTKEEQRLTSIIENFSFPNDRESILTALLFAKEKIDFISKEKVDRKSAYWMRLWCAKAEQLKQKADFFFPNDSIVKQSYDEIISDDEHVKKKIKVKVIIGVVIIGLVVATFVARSAIPFMEFSDKTDYSSTFTWQTNGLFGKLPQPSTNNGKIKMESKDRIQIELYNIEASDFEAYVKSCRDAGFTVDVTKTDSVFYAEDEEKYDLDIFYDDSKNTMSIYLDSYEIDNNTEAASSVPEETLTSTVM